MALTIIYFSSDSAPQTPRLITIASLYVYLRMWMCMYANDKQIKIENAIDKLAGDGRSTEI